MPIRSQELGEIKKQLEKINRKLDQMLEEQAAQRPQGDFVPNTLASLPKHLKETALAIVTLGQATAEQVAAKTGRTRAAESDHLNQLKRLGFLKKEKRGKEAYFLVHALYTICPSCRAKVLITSDRCANCGTTLPKSNSLEIPSKITKT